MTFLTAAGIAFFASFLVGEGLKRIGADPDVERALFENLELQRLFAGDAAVTLLPPGSSSQLGELLAAGPLGPGTAEAS